MNKHFVEFIPIVLVAIVLATAPAHSQNRSSKGALAGGLAIEDMAACRAEIEEYYQLELAEVRKRVESRAQEMQRERENIKWMEWLKRKQDQDQRHLDSILQDGAMGVFARYPITENRAGATKQIKELELEVRLLRDDPGGEQISRIVGITFTKETAATRIAFQRARICAFKLRIAQLDGKPLARGATAARSTGQ